MYRPGPALLALVVLSLPAVADTAKKPHVIFLLADGLGPGALGCWGGKVAPTPNIDRLAVEGVRFTSYYSAPPICSPSRCGLLTGQFPARWKITSYLQTRAGNRGCEQADYLDPKAPSLPRALKAAGYRTAHFGKWHLGGGRDVKDPPPFAAYGYDEHAGTWESPQPHPDITATNWIWSTEDRVKRFDRTAFFVDKTLDFLKRHKDRPCFVNVWLDDPHTPWVPDAKAARGAGTPANLRAVMTEVDKQVGRLLAGLKSLGIEKETLVIFTSDNGPLPTLKGARSGGLRGCKLSLYEGGIRLPFIARWPGTIPAKRTDEVTVLAAVDLFPTLCKLAGANLPTGMRPDGEDRSAALLGTPSRMRVRPLFWEYGRNERFFAYPGPKNGASAKDRSPNVAIREGRWKLLVNADGTAGELYDLSTDLAEQKNLIADQPQVARELTRAALEWRKSLP